jgi:hypothetical protein
MRLKSKIEREVDAIQLSVYEGPKDVPTAQLNDYCKKSGEAAAQKYGFKIVPGVSRTAAGKGITETGTDVRIAE